MIALEAVCWGSQTACLRSRWLSSASRYYRCFGNKHRHCVSDRDSQGCRVMACTLRSNDTNALVTTHSAVLTVATPPSTVPLGRQSVLQQPPMLPRPCASPLVWQQQQPQAAQHSITHVPHNSAANPAARCISAADSVLAESRGMQGVSAQHQPMPR